MHTLNDKTSKTGENLSELGVNKHSYKGSRKYYSQKKKIKIKTCSSKDNV